MFNQQTLLSLFLVFMLGSAGCASNGWLTKRYSSMTTKTLKQPGDIEVTMSVFSMNVPLSSADTTLLSLSDHGQASMIKVLGQKSQDTVTFLGSLGTPIEHPETFQKVVDHTMIKRRLVFSIEHQARTPADRMTSATIQVGSLNDETCNALPKQHCFVPRFKNWNQFATKYETVNLGAVTFTGQRGFGLGLSTGPPGGFVGATINASRSQELQESVELTQRISISGIFDPNTIKMVEEGAPGRDLTGNLIMDLTIQIADCPGSDLCHTKKTFFFGHMFDEKTGKPKPPEDIVVNRQTHYFVSQKDDIYASATLSATVRRVTKGAGTIPEGDDDVDLVSGDTKPLSFLLVPGKMLAFRYWNLVKIDNSGHKDFLSFTKPPSGSSYAMMFSSRDDAAGFLDYLRQVSQSQRFKSRVAHFDLLLKGKSLKRTDLEKLRVEISR